MSKKKKEEVKLKFIVKPEAKGVTVMCKEGTFVLNDEMKQKELSYIYENLSNGTKLIMKVPAS